MLSVVGLFELFVFVVVGAIMGDSSRDGGDVRWGDSESDSTLDGARRMRFRLWTTFVKPSSSIGVGALDAGLVAASFCDAVVVVADVEAASVCCDAAGFFARAFFAAFLFLAGAFGAEVLAADFTVASESTSEVAVCTFCPLRRSTSSRIELLRFLISSRCSSNCSA